MEFPIIKTDRLLLRQFTGTDLKDVYRGLSDPIITKYYGISYQSLEATKEQLKFFADLEKNGTGIWWAICSLHDGTFYGGAGFNNLSKAHRKAEIGFWLLQDAWHKGMIQEVVPLIFTYGFSNLNLHRIEAFVESENTACKNTMRQLNFIHEGTMRDCEIKNGELISLDIYSKLKTDI
ncbi:GNAT family protein [Pedobacter sp. KR3-3]|uniref:GNAT family protein n=1 Tax=Pedobacter albus TaxID=3113905 RepID=A0ABU7I5S8_9SPHI|nr:GNAT family protein [Pedobacter sp. KR3-3]MEE1944822.1 GNAT family protein [Pedobacter sp. KR3-3]